MGDLYVLDRARRVGSRGTLRSIKLTERERDLVAPVRAAAGPAGGTPRAGAGRLYGQRTRDRRANQPLAPQNRNRPWQVLCTCRRCAAKVTSFIPTEAAVITIDKPPLRLPQTARRSAPNGVWQRRAHLGVRWHFSCSMRDGMSLPFNQLGASRCCQKGSMPARC